MGLKGLWIWKYLLVKLFLQCEIKSYFRLRKPVGRMTMQEQILEGEFRHVNFRIITNRFDFKDFYKCLVRNPALCRLLFAILNHFELNPSCLGTFRKKFLKLLVMIIIVILFFF